MKNGIFIMFLGVLFICSFVYAEEGWYVDFESSTANTEYDVFVEQTEVVQGPENAQNDNVESQLVTDLRDQADDAIAGNQDLFCSSPLPPEAQEKSLSGNQYETPLDVFTNKPSPSEVLNNGVQNDLKRNNQLGGVPAKK